MIIMIVVLPAMIGNKVIYICTTQTTMRYKHYQGVRNTIHKPFLAVLRDFFPPRRGKCGRGGGRLGVVSHVKLGNRKTTYDQVPS